MPCESVRIPPPLPLSAYTRTLTPVYTPTSSTPSPFPSGPSPSPGRRRNASADPAERRPKRGDADYVKRPENAFILFRRQACADRASALSDSSPSPAPSDPNAPAPITLTGLPAKARQADLSKAISAQWRALPAEERAKWEARAAEKKREHEEKHPGYVYRPRKKPPKGQESMPIPAPTLPVPAAPHPMGLGLAPSLEFVLPAPRLPVASGSRSSSVPPATYPYQHVQVPDVYASQSPYGASASTDGAEYSLLPLIMSSAASKSQESTNLGGFDYLPASGNDGGNLGAFEANLMASDFLRSMFANPLPPSLPAPTTFALDGHDLSPASSPEPELATPGPAPGLSPGQPSFDGCAESWPTHPPPSSASALLSPRLVARHTLPMAVARAVHVHVPVALALERRRVHCASRRRVCVPEPGIRRAGL
ncbi:HMG box domain-containing protein [Mycena kentingensis (nom. inval.)]|nr:HMG box domain-containing protein [Mycena kentingensis (nom. inval.)]